jgi:hypothetical protein
VVVVVGSFVVVVCLVVLVCLTVVVVVVLVVVVAPDPADEKARIARTLARLSPLSLLPPT